MISLQIKILNSYFTNFNDLIEALGGEKNYSTHCKMKDSISLEKLEERDRQFLVEKIIHSIEFSNLYKTPIVKTPRDY